MIRVRVHPADDAVAEVLLGSMSFTLRCANPTIAARVVAEATAALEDYVRNLGRLAVERLADGIREDLDDAAALRRAAELLEGRFADASIAGVYYSGDLRNFADAIVEKLRDKGRLG